MLTALHCVAIVLGQFPDAEPDAMPWVLILKNGDPMVCYIADEDWQEGQSVQVKIDEPWINPGGDLDKKAYSRRLLKWDESYRERPRTWRNRHREGWEKAGYINVGSEEDMFFVSRVEEALATRATDMVDASAPVVPIDDAVPSSGHQATETIAPESTGPSFFEAWGLHFLIVAVAGCLAGLVVFTLVLK